MAGIKKALFKLRDFYEIAVPSLAFVMMFFVFIWGVFCRYVLKASSTWANEVQICGYLWTVLPAASWARRRNDHVCFSLLYDSVKLGTQRIIRIIGNLFMTVLYAFLCYGSITYIVNLRQKSMALSIPLKVLYLPFAFFVIGILIYSFTDLITDITDIYLEKTGKKEALKNEKVDLAAEFLKASEEEYKEMFNESQSEGKEDDK